MTYRFTKPSQEKPRIDAELSCEGLWGILLCHGVDLHNIHRRPTRFVWVVVAETWQLGLKGTERGQK